MNIYGLLVTKNEEKILEETLSHNTQYIKSIFILDGGNDNTYEIVKKFKEVKFYIHEKDLIKKHKNLKICDGMRGYLYNEILKFASVGDWVTLMHGDELFYHDPKVSIEIAEKKGANFVKWGSAHFFPHKSQFAKWDQLDDMPFNKKLCYYGHFENKFFLENRQFRIEKDSNYDLQLHGCVLPTKRKVHYVAYKKYPILIHYKIWNVDLKNYNSLNTTNKIEPQNSTVKGKWSQLPFEINSKNDLFLEKLPGYPCTSYFDDNFGRLEEEYDKFVKDHKLTIRHTIKLFLYKILRDSKFRFLLILSAKLFPKRHFGCG
jgi:hypothetical protein